MRPLILSVGEPRHAPPPMVAEILAAHAADWGRYPPVEGTAEFRRAVAGWLQRRYELPAGLVDPDRHVLPVAGTREALFLIGQVAVPAEKGGRPPLVLMPNPFYQVYFGAAVFARAEPVFLQATRHTGFLPDLAAIDAATLARTAMLYLCSPANPQGAVASPTLLQSAVALARAHDFVLCVDECYADIWDAEPPPGRACRLAARSARVSPTSSSSIHCPSAPAFPVSAPASLPATPRLIAAFRRLRAFGGAALPLPVLAASTALWNDDAHAAANRARYRAKFDLAERLLGRPIRLPPPGRRLFSVARCGRWERRRAHPVAAGGAPRPAWCLSGKGFRRDGSNPGRAYIRVALVDDLAATEDALRKLLNVL